MVDFGRIILFGGRHWGSVITVVFLVGEASLYVLFRGVLFVARLMGKRVFRRGYILI